MDRGYVERNDASRARLRSLLDRLADEDLERHVGEWTVAMTLAHLAFWDQLNILRWQEAVASGRDTPVSMGGPQTDVINDANLALWSKALDAAGIRGFVLEATEAFDAHAAALPDAMVAAAQAAGMERTLDRSAHRAAHLAPIEAELGLD